MLTWLLANAHVGLNQPYILLVQVMDFELQRQLVPYMKDIAPLPGIYDPDFIAANQDTRANNVVKGSKKEQMEAVRQHIRDFKQSTGVDKVVVLWTANTERYAQVCSPVLTS